MEDQVISLDSEQASIVDYMNSQLIIAGPGSGKTRVLTEKARKVFSMDKSLICISFTRGAAKEMARRVPMIPSTTIHSLCNGYMGWDEKGGYGSLLERFVAWPDKTRYDWVLVDETQDLSPMEMDVVLSIVGECIFAVGDPHQSIYGFQEAMGPSVVDLLTTLGCKPFDLTNNYRSAQSIVDKLNKVFKRSLVSRNIKDVGLDAILCRSNETLFQVSRLLEQEGISHKVRLAEAQKDKKLGREYIVLEGGSLVVCTIHASKGLEFDKVYLYDWFPDVRNEEEIRVYYVAMSRASKEFHEVHTPEGLTNLLERRNN